MIDGKLQMIYKFVNGDTVYYKKYRKETLYNIILESYDTMKVNNMIVETMKPTLLVAQLFNGSLSKEKRKQVIQSMEKHHKNVRKDKKKMKNLNNYRV